MQSNGSKRTSHAPSGFGSLLPAATSTDPRDCAYLRAGIRPVSQPPRLMLITSLLRFAAAVIASATLEQVAMKGIFPTNREQSKPIDAIPKPLSESPQARPARG